MSNSLLISNLEEELDYYKYKCGSLEEGLFKQDRAIRNNYKVYKSVVDEKERLKNENNDLKCKLAKVEEIINNRLSSDFRPVWDDGKTELFVEEKVGYKRALIQLKKKLIKENIIDDEVNHEE